jgi:hypothetical protein
MGGRLGSSRQHREQSHPNRKKRILETTGRGTALFVFAHDSGLKERFDCGLYGAGRLQFMGPNDAAGEEPFAFLFGNGLKSARGMGPMNPSVP